MSTARCVARDIRVGDPATSVRAVRDGEIGEAITAVWERSTHLWSARSMSRLDHDIRCGRKRVARLMRQAGLEGADDAAARTDRRNLAALLSADLVEARVPAEGRTDSGLRTSPSMDRRSLAVSRDADRRDSRPRRLVDGRRTCAPNSFSTCSTGRLDRRPGEGLVHPPTTAASTRAARKTTPRSAASSDRWADRRLLDNAAARALRDAQPSCCAAFIGDARGDDSDLDYIEGSQPPPTALHLDYQSLPTMNTTTPPRGRLAIRCPRNRVNSMTPEGLACLRG